MRKRKIVSIICVALMLATILPASLLAADENRIAGSDRYDTAIAISRAGWTTAENVVLSPAADANRTDTLSAAPLAKALGAPILLTDGRTLTPGTLAEITRLGAKNVYITSGAGVITPAVHEALSGRGLTPVPLGGANRFETAVNIANEIAKHGAVTTVVFTSTQNDADALSMASLAAANGWVLFPAARDALAPVITDWLGGQNVSKTYVIGSADLLSDAAVAALPAVTRIGGADPYTNNAAILEYFADSFDYSRGLFVSSGDPAHLVDAVTASAYLNGAPLFLAPSAVTAGSAAAAALQNVIGLKTSVITAIGGTGAVSSAALTTVNQAASGSLPATGAEGGSTSPAPIPGGSGGNSLPVPGRINLSYAGEFAVPQPGTAAATNYLVLNVSGGEYTSGEYLIDGIPAPTTPVLTNAGRAAVVKVEVPAGLTAGTLTVTQNNQTRLTRELTGLTAGAAAPEAFYGETPMAFSEFYHDITAGITDGRPEVTSFTAGATVAQPAFFINGGTFRGAGPAGPGTLPTYTEADAQPAVDAVSTATYGDYPHFPPTGNLILNYDDPQTKTDANNKIMGIKAVEVGVDFDLYANAYLLNATQRATAQSEAVRAAVEKITAKQAGAVYKAKYLFPDASWGARVAVNETAAGAWPSTPAISASYGGNWANRVVSVNYAPLPSDITSASLWDDYFELLYGGYVEDLTTGQKEPLVWLQNLFSHKMHTNFEVALTRPGISRMNALSGSGNFRFVVYAKGLPDIIFEQSLVEYAVSDAEIEQGNAFFVTGNHLLGENTQALPEGDRLHIVGLSPEALADFTANGAKLLKGSAEVPDAAYNLNLAGGGGEVEIELLQPFFDPGFQGAYTVSINSDTIYQMPSFTVYKVINQRPQLTYNGQNYAAVSADAPLITEVGGLTVGFSDSDYAAAITVGTRGGSSITVESGSGSAPAIGDALKRSGGNSPYVIEPSALTAGTVYKLSLVAANHAYRDGASFKTTPIDYYIMRPVVQSYATPNNIGATDVTNYLLFNKNGVSDIKLNNVAVTPTPVLGADLVKVKVADGATNATLSLDGVNYAFSGLTAGTAAPALFYGETPMAFSEFYHDITADITDERPAVTSFAPGGAIAQPVFFINGGT
ncbi:MAG: cell wall-binding repeat-containing protein, partial [Gracilibacteraceae bacterium]|nr:cell wall-binding repeat-containing protein [Gracilibacteraceae bacterium]